MMQGNTIKLLKRIDLGTTTFPHRCREAAIQRDALDALEPAQQAAARRVLHLGRHAQIDALRLLHVAEVDRVEPGAALVRDHGRLRVSQEGPGGGAEEGVGFDVGGAGAGAEPAELVFDEEFADEGFAEARMGPGGLAL